MSPHTALWIQNSCRGLGIPSPMHRIEITDNKIHFTQLIARELNLIAVKGFIFQRRAGVDGATQDRAALMIDVRADGTDAIRREDFLDQARIAFRI